MTKINLDRALQTIKTEVKESVTSYFSPVRAVIRDVSLSVEKGSAVRESGKTSFTKNQKG